MARPKRDSMTEISTPKIVKETAQIKNLSLQGFELCFGAEGGFGSVWIGPRQVIEIPKSHISSQILNLQSRRLIRIQ